MKQLLLDGFYCWSIFSEEKQMDFNGHLWVRPNGNVIIDPVAPSDADLAQIKKLGGAKWCVITNSDHRRATESLQKALGFEIICHAADVEALGLPVARTVAGGEEIVPGLVALHMPHGKTPGEIALMLPEHQAIVFGDIVRGSPVGTLRVLPDAKLKSPLDALFSLRRLLPLSLQHALVGDGASVFRHGHRALLEAFAHHHDVDVFRINLAQLAWAPASADPRYHHEIKEVSRCIGAQALGYNVRRLPPRSKSGPMHYHHNQEEFFFVLDGTCHLERPAETIELRAGDFVSFPPGEQGTHTLSNRSDAPCEVLCVSNLPDYDHRELVGITDFRRDLLIP